MAIRLVVMLLEGAFVELAPAERAVEVLRVEFLLHRRYATTGDRLLACSAQCTTTCVVVLLAVAASLVLVESAAGERTTAVLQATSAPEQAHY